MKTARLVIGIISIVLSVLILFQSCAAGVVEAIEAEGGTSGSAGVLVGFFYLAAGIVGIACRKNKPGSIVAGGLFFLGFLIGATNMGVFGDLAIWAFLALAFAIVFIAGGILQKKPIKSQKADEDE